MNLVEITVWRLPTIFRQNVRNQSIRLFHSSILDQEVFYSHFIIISLPELTGIQSCWDVRLKYHSLEAAKARESRAWTEDRAGIFIDFQWWLITVNWEN